MNASATVAAHLDDHTEAIIDLWRSVVRRSGDVPQADSLSHAQFRDHVPILIERMVDRLHGRPADVTKAAEKHGHERWVQGYDIVEVVTELGHLRTALVHATFTIARQQGLDLATVESAQKVIHEILNESQSESVRQFQLESRDEQTSILAQIEDRGRVLETATLAAELEKTKLMVLLEGLPVGVWVADATGQIVNLNREAESLQLVPAEDTIGRVNINANTPLYQFFRPDGTGYRPHELPLARAIQGETVDQEEMLWAQPQGVRIIVASARPMRDLSGQVIGAVGVAQDMTLKRRLQAELVAASAQLKGIVEQSPVMIWRTGPDGVNNFVNRTYLDFLGVPARIATSERWLEVVHPEDVDGVVSRFLIALEARAPFFHEFRVTDAKGRSRWLASNAVPFFDEKNSFLGYLGTCIDITDQHELERALQRQREIAEQSSQHKTRLMSALSHDARTPLNAVVLSAQLLEMHVQDGEDPEVGECLRTIRNGVKNVLDLLGDMLDLTRIDAGAMPVDLSRFAIDGPILECVSSIQTPARLKGLDCRVELDGLKGLTVVTDRAKLKQILSNFLSNALRYTERGHILLSAELRDKEMRISVEDSGTGIAEADQVRVFDEFAVLENPHRTPGEGTGLGLAICRRLAGLLGGKIELQSVIGVGTTFTLVLPTSTVERQAPSNPAVVAISRVRSQGSILVVEDHADSRRTLARVLRKMGYEVREACDGLEALALAREERPAAILMDVNMPGMDGIDATFAIRADAGLRDVAIFALTGDVTTENQTRIEKAGVQGYLEKPVTADALRNALAAIELLSSGTDGILNSARINGGGSTDSGHKEPPAGQSSMRRR